MNLRLQIFSNYSSTNHLFIKSQPIPGEIFFVAYVHLDMYSNIYLSSAHDDKLGIPSTTILILYTTYIHSKFVLYTPHTIINHSFENLLVLLIFFYLKNKMLVRQSKFMVNNSLIIYLLSNF